MQALAAAALMFCFSSALFAVSCSMLDSSSEIFASEAEIAWSSHRTSAATPAWART